jgi:hypothetical protein
MKTSTPLALSFALNLTSLALLMAGCAEPSGSADATAPPTDTTGATGDTASTVADTSTPDGLDDSNATTALDTSGFTETGYAYLVVEPSEVDFGIRAVDDVRTIDLDLENAGNRPLRITRIAFVGLDGSGPTEAFAINRAGPIDLEPGLSTKVKLTFYVLAEFPYEDRLRFESNSTTGPIELRVSGGGTIFTCVDLDGDAHGPYCDAGEDCDQADPTTFAGAPELCDGRDNDCDALRDEDFVGLATACTTATGACQTDGFRVCRADGSGTECRTNPVTGGDELCNAIDDDCDGATDEDFPELGGLCKVGLGACTRADKWVCSADQSGVACNVPAGSPVDEIEGNAIDDDCDGVTDEAPPTDVGCADEEREGFLDPATWPDIAACAGAWSVGGVISEQLLPTCARGGGDDGIILDGRGCSASDLCAEGWHICATSAEVAAKSPTGCNGAAPGIAAFFATRQSGTGCAQCATGTLTGGNCNNPASCTSGCASNVFLSNDVFGCGTMGVPPAASCAPLNVFSQNNCWALQAPWACSGGTIEAANIAKSGPESGGVLCCRD